jgi:pimeloyl-ACP methyl ester carboxylesterase
MRYFVTPGEDRQLDAASRRGLRGSFVELSDGVTHYELSGPDDAEVAVLVGGLTIPLFYWDALASELHARGLRTLAYSGYGRGYSDRVQARYDEALFVRQLTELTERLGLARPHHVVGPSMGALIAMAYTGEHVGSTSTLTLVGPAGLAKRPPSLSWLLRSDRLAGFIAKWHGRRMLERHLGHNVRDPGRAAELAAMIRDAYRYEGSMYALFTTLQNFRQSERSELYRRTGALRVPTMLLWGADDQVTPIDQLDTARALLRSLECHVIPECGHMVPFERPRDVADKIASFAACRAERLAR